MSYAQHADNIRKAIAELRSTRGTETALIMHDDVALVKSRVINTGQLGDGSSGKYSKAVTKSPNYIPDLVRMKFTNPIAKLKTIQKKHGWFFSYETFRAETGRTVAFKNFSLSGNMWKKIKALVVSDTADSTTYTLGGEDPETQKLVDFNTAQSGDFLAQSDADKALISKLNRQRVFKVLQKYNLA
jgi:hypothetical protein